MALILCLETATTNCSVALSKNGQLLALKEDKSNNYSHAEKLHVFIDEILNENNLGVQNLDAVAVSKGPGSYTGLRIGVSAAKGLCFSLGIPLIAIPTLNSLAAQAELEKGFIVPMLDARRMEVYASVFDENLDELRETKAEVLDENSFSHFLEKNTTVFVGNGVEKFKAICTHPNARFILDKLPSAKEMCSLAEAKYKISDTEDVAYFEPYYLKDFIAG
ncbi:tRNA (adenosine(37)-N6)-threonylcarbamoyltransferase complex dimerization subunit type 1 TsaB [Salegentibacter maritimus]|jgi:tRNA threonylcarbamoyladenosine biosynthesis protein TsaB|uniref:tRNA (Adenosine(37)-N6)-threonylcarbamoyltransferase complex dimerization subunit type 1 TsaB n=1 Tax=Salegentibacter maritimus TaxID=2794347 RepID=A0ABS0TE14_9FLAO|nr:tRNA (adenosine(37)-N6)-threonylcarbamoyltransferase complex dimerization subunit type 1 TsaB [Salegentibacter maritimus]MBI6119243.1 tRNA (adenosine(37)-N6)-threonylcarbamoyltransferase complex dimerization subunit type 1 TsaB [Salegentibacter maritimus]